MIPATCAQTELIFYEIRTETSRAFPLASTSCTNFGTTAVVAAFRLRVYLYEYFEAFIVFTSGFIYSYRRCVSCLCDDSSQRVRTQTITHTQMTRIPDAVNNMKFDTRIRKSRTNSEQKWLFAEFLFVGAASRMNCEWHLRSHVKPLYVLNALKLQLSCRQTPFRVCRAANNQAQE